MASLSISNCLMLRLYFIQFFEQESTSKRNLAAASSIKSIAFIRQESITDIMT